MDNLYDTLRANLSYNKFEVGDLLFVEYTCPLEGEWDTVWSHSDYIVHVLSGKKTWKTMEGSWTVTAGQSLYIKKGASFVHQYFDRDFCLLGFFVSDDLIRETISELLINRSIPHLEESVQFTSTYVEHDDAISVFFQSILPYFTTKFKPGDPILKLKFKELIIQIVSSGKNNLIASYFNYINKHSRPSLSHIMEANFCFNLSLEEFAKMCHRSVSSFKRDFQNYYHTSPGRWLLRKRLDYAANLLRSDYSSVTQIAFECGFEDVSHFSKAFKKRFGQAPSVFAGAKIDI